jgi:hypothetical protein
MRYGSAYLMILLCFSIVSVPVAAKVGVHATIHTTIPAAARAGTLLDISWTLSNEKSSRPFNACAVFIRLIGPTGESTEAFARCGTNMDGRYNAPAEIPKGGVETIEVGVAGTMTDRAGHSERSDWLMALANDPVQKSWQDFGTLRLNWPNTESAGLFVIPGRKRAREIP